MRKWLLIVFVAILGQFAFSQNFEIYVSDAGNFNNPPWQILKFDSSGKNPSVFINTNLNWPQDILFLEDSNEVLISNLGTNRITKHNAKTGAYLSDFARSIGGPTRFKIGPDGLLYVLQWRGNGKVLRYKLSGEFVDEFTSVGVNQSIGLDWDKNGDLYVSSYNGDMVRRFGTDGKDLGVFINSNLAGPTNIWFDEAGDLLVADYDGSAVKRFDSDGKYKGDFLTGLRNCEGVALLPNGDILIGNGNSHSVKRFDKTGTYKNDFIAASSGKLLTPNAVIIRTIPKNTKVNKPAAKADIFFPNAGSAFTLQPQYAELVKSANIYGTSGQLVDSIDLGVGSVWDAKHIENGLYIMEITFKDGSQQSQKVVVKH